MSLGAYSVAMGRQAQRRRALLGTASVALVAIVGLASLYVATSPREGGDVPESAAVVTATAAASVEPTIEARRNMGPAIGSVDLSEVELEPLPEPALGEGAPNNEPMLEPAAQAETATASEIVAEAQAQPPADAEAQLRPELEAQPRPQPPTEPQPQRAAPKAGDDIVWRNGWVCGGELTLEESRLRAWSITRASFEPGSGYERVVLQLQRIGPGSGQPASLSAEAHPRTKVQRHVPGVRQPSLGRTAIALQFSDGVKTDLTLRGYRPSGLATVKEFSAYPAGPRGSRVLISTTTDDGCFRVRTPAWSGSSRAQKGQIVVDVKS